MAENLNLSIHLDLLPSVLKHNHFCLLALFIWHFPSPSFACLLPGVPWDSRGWHGVLALGDGTPGGGPASALTGLCPLGLAMCCVHPTPLADIFSSTTVCIEQSHTHCCFFVPVVNLFLLKPTSVSFFRENDNCRGFSVPPGHAWASVGLLSGLLTQTLPSALLIHCLESSWTWGFSRVLLSVSSGHIWERRHKTPLFWRSPNSLERSH